MSRTIITNASVVLHDGIAENSAVIVEDGKFLSIISMDKFEPLPADEITDAAGDFLAPGFIDLHIHGTGEYLIDNGPADLEKLCSLLPQYGVTSFLPTVCPLPKGKDAELLNSLSKVASSGSEILGFHLEGPFVSITGALPPEALGSADVERVKSLIAAAQPLNVIFSISPEFKGICDLIPVMKNGDNAVFMTHTKANVKQTESAIEAGATHATHFYDVFYAPDETDGGVRPCGAVEVILADKNVSVDFILDGEHVDASAVKMAINCKGIEKVCLITDGQIGAGLAPGRYSFVSGEVEFKYPGGPARFTENSGYPGGLAGSGLTMDRAVRNATKMLDIAPHQAIAMASTSPAGVLGLHDRKGAVKEGYDADFVILDEDLNVLQTWIAGQCRYRK